MRTRWCALSIAIGLLCGACTAEQQSADGGGPPGEATSAAETTTPEPPPVVPAPCTAGPVEIDLDALPAPTEDATIELSRLVYPCAESVVLVAAGADGLLGEAASVAIAVHAPLLVFEGGVLSDPLRSELARLGPGRIRIYGEVSSTGLDDLPVVTRIPDDPGAPPIDRQLAEVADDIRTEDPPRVVFVEPPGNARATLTALPLLVAAGMHAVLVDPDRPETLEELQGFRDSQIVTAAELTPTERWRVDLALSGVELPGGGTTVFPGRRMVAFYGSPVTHRLGVLGEQDPEQTLERLTPIVESYVTEEHPIVVPTFELIVTVATGSPGAEGDYSQRVGQDDVREWVDFAAENDAFVLLDLQPGRTDFLSQAKEYESFLREPHVGLALDPEWRLGPGEMPLERIGSVGAAEVNDVVAWLADIVREGALPQKPLILHQFLPRMLGGRARIDTPPELAVVVHVDGQGSLPSKFATYETITELEQGADQQIWWGWKNFYDEDFPVATPERVNEVDPLPLVVTYQ